MKFKFLQYITLILFLTNCTVNYGQLNLVGHLPDDLEEVSGVESIPNSDDFWMINDGGNDATLFLVDSKGKIDKRVEMNIRNDDWEDLTKDTSGNIYIGDFGNNQNKRKHLKIYKVSSQQLKQGNTSAVTEIEFYFPEQKKFPPKRKNRFYDVESFFHHNGYLYIFTKSRVKDAYGRTNLYRVPAKAGKHKATYINTFNTCESSNCWITSAAISPNGKKVVLLSHENVWEFTNFKNDDFLGGTVKKHNLKHSSQKEGICFKNNSTVYITDEQAHGKGRNLYVFSLD